MGGDEHHGMTAVAGTDATPPADAAPGLVDTTGNGLEARLAHIEQRLAAVVHQGHGSGTEMASLRDELRRSRRQRLLDGTAVITLLALVFSAVTFLADRRAQEREDERAARERLAELIQQINALPRDQASFRASVGPETAELLGGNLTSEQMILLGQIDAIRSDHQQLFTAIDYFALGEAHQRVGNFQGALKAFADAERLARDPVMAVAALRGRANTLFALGDAGGARDTFERALEIRSRFPDMAEVLDEYSALLTLVNWAGAAAGAKACAEAREVLERVHGAAAVNPAVYASLQNTVRGVEASVAGCGGQS